MNFRLLWAHQHHHHHRWGINRLSHALTLSLCYLKQFFCLWVIAIFNITHIAAHIHKHDGWKVRRCFIITARNKSTNSFTSSQPHIISRSLNTIFFKFIKKKFSINLLLVKKDFFPLHGSKPNTLRGLEVGALGGRKDFLTKKTFNFFYFFCASSTRAPRTRRWFIKCFYFFQRPHNCCLSSCKSSRFVGNIYLNLRAEKIHNTQHKKELNLSRVHDHENEKS